MELTCVHAQWYAHVRFTVQPTVLTTALRLSTLPPMSDPVPTPTAGPVLLRNAVRHYAWGSRTVLPACSASRSRPPSRGPRSGWVPTRSTRRYLPDGRSLAEVEPGLPYLVKLLAAEEPLSIQAHPDLEQARAGFAAQEAGGGPDPDSAERSYKDANHKPELLVAVEPTQALCGFRTLLGRPSGRARRGRRVLAGAGRAAPAARAPTTPGGCARCSPRR